MQPKLSPLTGKNLIATCPSDSHSKSPTRQSTGRCAIKPRSAGDFHVGHLMGIPNMLKVSLLLSSALFSCIAHSECKMNAYQIHGVVTNSTNQKIAASIRFSWLDNETKKRNLAALTDAGDYSATLYYDTQSKADSTSGRIYNCDAKLKTVQYVID